MVVKTIALNPTASSTPTDTAGRSRNTSRTGICTTGRYRRNERAVARPLYPGWVDAQLVGHRRPEVLASSSSSGVIVPEARLSDSSRSRGRCRGFRASGAWSRQEADREASMVHLGREIHID